MGEGAADFIKTLINLRKVVLFEEGYVDNIHAVDLVYENINSIMDPIINKFISMLVWLIILLKQVKNITTTIDEISSQ